MSRVVHVITRFIDGGADENTLLTCNKFAEKGNDVWLIYGGEYSETILSKLHSKVVPICIPSMLRSISPVKDIKSLLQMVSVYRKISPDVIHTHTSKAGIVGRIAGFFVPNVKIVHGVHILPFMNVGFVQEKIYLFLEKLCALGTDAFISVSDAMKDVCLDNNVGDESKHHVIESGMEIGDFVNALGATDILRMRSTQPEFVYVCYVAALEKRKRHKELLASISKRQEQQNAKIRFIFAGKGELLEELEEDIEAYGLQDTVACLGFRNDPQAVIAACDMSVYASSREGLPRAIIQAAISGKPQVVSYLPGVERVVKDGVNGVIVDGDSIDSLVDRVFELAESGNGLSKLSGSSHGIDFSYWSADYMVDRIELVYREIGVRT